MKIVGEGRNSVNPTKTQGCLTILTPGMDLPVGSIWKNLRETLESVILHFLVLLWTHQLLKDALTLYNDPKIAQN